MTATQQTTIDSRPLIFGEVLFDCFPENRVLGGAPFNVAWNLRGLGVNPYVMTAVGPDDLGIEVLERARSWSIDCSYIQQSSFPTGRVDISLRNGEPTYKFWDDVAFDHIVIDPSAANGLQPALLYHGSLALRRRQSRQTLLTLRETLSCPTFLDINLRLPHFDFDFTPLLLNRIQHLKLNHEELALLTSKRTGSQVEELSSWDARLQAASELQVQYEIENIWLTAAQHGAAWLGSNKRTAVVEAPQVENLVDTVGAGDALTAVIIHGLLTGRPATDSLRDAAHFAARVCQLRGAISMDPDFYRL